MCGVYGEACFSKKFSTNRLNMGLSLWVKNTVHGMKIQWATCKGFSVTNSKGKIYFTNWMTLEYINIYIYMIGLVSLFNGISIFMIYTYIYIYIERERERERERDR